MNEVKVKVNVNVNVNVNLEAHFSMLIFSTSSTFFALQPVSACSVVPEQ